MFAVKELELDLVGLENRERMHAREVVTCLLAPAKRNAVANSRAVTS